ncbi:MAG: hypothetical protein N3A54_05520 [Patescibacteria group bacterium]|nr:hypothetical protein [Patescibacteria group bacterium]
MELSEHHHKNILDRFIESLGLSSKLEYSDRLSSEALMTRHQDIQVWIQCGSKLSDDGITSGIELSERLVAPAAIGDKVSEEPWNIQDFRDDQEFRETFVFVRDAVRNDLEQNEGRKFRKIIETCSADVLNIVFGNEFVREWIQQQEPLTVYDFEKAVVSAVIMQITSVYYDEYIRKMGRDEN